MNSLLFFVLLTRGNDRIVDVLDSVKHVSKVNFTCLFLHFKFSKSEKMSNYLRGPTLAAHILVRWMVLFLRICGKCIFPTHSFSDIVSGPLIPST